MWWGNCLSNMIQISTFFKRVEQTTSILLAVFVLHVVARFDRHDNSVDNTQAHGGNEMSNIECRSYTIQQVVHHVGCKNRTIENQYCSGQCFSSWEPYIKGTPKHYGKICSACQPVSKYKQAVTLTCEGVKGGLRYVDVEIVKSCKCQRFTCKASGKQPKVLLDHRWITSRCYSPLGLTLFGSRERIGQKNWCQRNIEVRSNQNWRSGIKDRSIQRRKVVIGEILNKVDIWGAMLLMCAWSSFWYLYHVV